MTRSPQQIFRGKRIPWGWLIAFWTLVGIVFSGYNSLIRLSVGAPVSARGIFWTFMGQYLWVPLTPLAVHFANKYAIDWHRWKKRVLLHLGIAALIVLVESFVYALMHSAEAYLFDREYHLLVGFRITLLRGFFFDVLIYSVIVAIVHALDYYARNAQLEAQLAQARLRALRMQLNPHFLFNTLHAISSLMDENVREARRMMANLSDLLRYTFDNTHEPEVPLNDELVFLERYLKIEQARFHDRLRVSIDVDEDSRGALVPSLILQPLVENAIKHGVAPYAAEGRIEVLANRSDGRLLLHVKDNGPGLNGHATTKVRAGVGIENTRKRLYELYGDDQRFELDSDPERGLCVTLDLPFRKP